MTIAQNNECSRRATKVVSIFFALCIGILPLCASAMVRDLTFPVDSEATFRDDFGEPRGSRRHEGIDIHADKMTPILSATDGIVKYVMIPEPSWGYEISIQDDDGYSYNYIHVNNDTPGTDDGMGGPTNAYAPGITHGVRVARGQHIGWVGDSGNAEDIGPHLHFEMEAPDGTPIDAFESLVFAYAKRIQAVGVASSSVAQTSTATTTISTPTRSASSSFIFTRYLSSGAKGDEVVRLQTLLMHLGHFDHPVATGYFGPVTESAVKKFQKSKGIEQLGIVGPKTRLALNAVRGKEGLD